MKYLLIALLCLNVSCTVSSYKDSERKFYIVDLHPGGEAVAIAGKIEGKAELRVDRQTADATPALEAATIAAARIAAGVP